VLAYAKDIPHGYLFLKWKLTQMISLLLDILYLGLQDECHNTSLDKSVMTHVYLLDEKIYVEDTVFLF
jgi:hypothetical protein